MHKFFPFHQGKRKNESSQTKRVSYPFEDAFQRSKNWFVFSLAFAVIFLPGQGLFAQNQNVYNSVTDTSWTAPAGCTSFYVEMWGGGGSGIVVDAGDDLKTGMGGGGSPYVKTKTYNMVAHEKRSFRILVGKGGLNSGNTQTDGMRSGFRFPNGYIYSGVGLGGDYGLGLAGRYIMHDAGILSGNVLEYQLPGIGSSGQKCAYVYGGGGGGSGFTNASGVGGTTPNCSPGIGGNGTGRGGDQNSDGAQPGGGGGGGLNRSKGGDGRVSITYFCSTPNAGTIALIDQRSTSTAVGNPGLITTQSLVVPTPYENNPALGGNILVRDTYATNDFGLGSSNYTWLQNGSTIPGISGYSYSIPGQLSPGTYTFARRVTTACGNSATTASVTLKVVEPNGRVYGNVYGKTGAIGISGCTLTVRKTTGLPGSIVAKTYQVFTAYDGSFDLKKIFYGDPTAGSDEATFTIIPSRGNDVFEPASRTFTLSRSFPEKNLDPSLSVAFRNMSGYTIIGKVAQQCKGCLDANGNPSTIPSGLPDAVIKSNNTFSTKTINSLNKFGEYAVQVDNPGNYTIRPEYPNLRFVPDTQRVTVIAGNLAGINFTDTTHHEISGFFRAGCGEYIGTVTLEFQDVLVKDKNGVDRPAEFRKRVTTTIDSGFYSIRLPARRYRIKVIGFTPKPDMNTYSPADKISQADLEQFFNTNFDSTVVKTALPYDSLLVDNREGNTIRNFTYQRSPTLTITGMEYSTCSGNLQNYHLVSQSKKRVYAVRVWQGSETRNCPVLRDTVRILTNIHTDDENGPLRKIPVVNGEAKDSLVGGTPNILAPFRKTFTAEFTDSYLRQAEGLTHNVVVTGVKADNASSFATTSPEIPLMVLHDPPGDQSSSFWETNKTSETAIRFNVASETESSGWAEVKVGAKFSSGLGVEVENEVWGTINSSLSVSGRINDAREAIVSTTTTQNISTSSDEDVTGDDGDLFIGAALNLIYSRAFEVKLNDQCQLEAPKKLMIAQDGFGTQYVYTAAAIRDNVIPTLRGFVNNPGNTPSQSNNYRNQVKVWEQVLRNNQINKDRAAFDKNISFFGSSGPIANSTTSTTTNSSSLEFEMAIESNLAAELGFEVGGSGGSGGVNVRFRSEIGSSVTETNTSSTTIGYTLDDNDALDNFSVNVRKDPVYKTPVFQTVAGQSSCPPEANTLSRDEPSLVISDPDVTVPASQDAIFNFLLGNLSVDVAPRTYHLSFDQSSNPFGANISVGGIPMGFSPIPYSIGQLDVVPVTVNVKRNQSNNAYTYEGLKFNLTDACTGEVVKSGNITARFEVPCSPVTLASPLENWVCNQSNNNIIPITIKGYTLANLQSIALEYSKEGSTYWTTAFSRVSGDLSNGPNGTTIQWNVSNVADGEYNLRVRLTCASGTTYTERVNGLIDRNSPQVLGVPQPSDAVFAVGDEISFSYTENLFTADLNDNKAELRLLTTNELIPSFVTGYANKLIVVPSTDLMVWSGQLVRLIVKAVSDMHGNQRSNSDTLLFAVGSFVPSTGNKSLVLVLDSAAILPENSNRSFAFRFQLPVNTPVDAQVNFTVGGTATYSDDYSVSFSNSNPLNQLAGTNGRLVIPRNQRSVTMYLKPKQDAVLEADETILIHLSEGGDYNIGPDYSAAATIVDNSLAPPTITGPNQFCTGTSVTLNANHPLAGNPGYAFLWSNGATTPTISISQPGTYTVRISDAGGLSQVSAGFVLSAYAVPNVQAGADFNVTQNTGNFPLGGSPSGGVWSGSGVSGTNFNSQQPLGMYSLAYCFTTPDGCTRCDTVVATIGTVPLPPVATPTFGSAPGTYANPVAVSLSSTTPGSTIYYTINGLNPVPGTSYTFLYSAPVQIIQTAMLKAIALAPGAPNSGIASGLFTITNPTIVATPVIAPPTGTYSSSRLVTISTTTPGAEIYYTTTGNIPVVGTGYTRLYTSPFWVVSSSTIRAVGIKSGFSNSGIAVSFITISGPVGAVPEPLSIHPSPGQFSSPQTVELNYPDASATLYYTLDGSEPEPGSPSTFVYSGPFELAASATVVAIAMRDNALTGILDPSVYQIGTVTTVDGQMENFRCSVYPNPSSSGIFEIQRTQEEDNQAAPFEVTSIDGRTICSGVLQKNSQRIDLRSYPAGMYQLKITRSRTRELHRLIRQ